MPNHTTKSIHPSTSQVLRFLVLALILGIGVSLFWANQGKPSQQFFIGTIMAGMYFLWGVLYHTLEGDLHPKIVVEYLLMSLLSVILLRGALFTRL
ncbi:hypothetical protein HYW55_03590 [Candidatus Gottesmanbacteria bacterium]|nr:hypothetical protein [Candidatus Gottesmanbacteria bacterium]